MSNRQGESYESFRVDVKQSRVRSDDRLQTQEDTTRKALAVAAIAVSSISPAVDRLIEQPNSSASKQSMDDAIAGFAAPRAGSWVG